MVNLEIDFDVGHELEGARVVTLDDEWTIRELDRGIDESGIHYYVAEYEASVAIRVPLDNPAVARFWERRPFDAKDGDYGYFVGTLKVVARSGPELILEEGERLPDPWDLEWVEWQLT